VDVSVVLLFVVAAAVGLFAWQRQRRSQYQDWYYQRWRKVDRERRRRIVRAVRHGEAVEDPRDAALALEFIDAQHRLTQKSGGGARWTMRVHYVLLASLALSLSFVRPDAKLIAFSVLPLAYLLALRLAAQRLRARVAAAREKNEQLTRLL
jgi:hypothetical protein